jgi:cytochrome c oxidase cbb3-type subunit 3
VYSQDASSGLRLALIVHRFCYAPHYLGRNEICKPEPGNNNDNHGNPMYRRFFPLLLLILSACQPAAEPAGTIPTETAGTPAPEASAESPQARAARLQNTFPAQQRAPQDPALVARGQDIYGVNCRSCHGQDLRGGDLGGPNLLRADTVLQDSAGELIGEVIRNGRSTPGMTEMPALNLPDADVEAVAAFIHSIVATSRGQGAPPPGTEVPLNIIVGDPEAGAHYFQAQCTGCHSSTGDLAGIATRITDAETLQNSWVAGRTWGEPVDNADPRRQVRVTVSLDNGQSISGRLRRHDDFVVSLTTDAGEYRTFTLHGNTSPAVSSISIDDPLAGHQQMLRELDDATMHDMTAYLVTLK